MLSGALAIVLAVAALASAASAQPSNGSRAADLNAYATPQRLVEIDPGRKINLYCVGRGSPTVVLDGGLGETSLIWARVQPALAKSTRVCSYDRAGLGFSDKGPFPRDADHIASDLWAVLQAGNVRGPYIMVAHSLTGQTMRLFVSRHLPEVAGVVLIEPALTHVDQKVPTMTPEVARLITGGSQSSDNCMKTIASGVSHEEMYKACGGHPPKLPGYPDRLNEALAKMYVDPDFAKTAISESESMKDGANTSEIEAEQRSYGSIPLIILTATIRPEAKTPEARAGLQAVWASEGQALLPLSHAAKQVIVDGADHGIQYSKPEAVVETIDDLIKGARKR